MASLVPDGQAPPEQSMLGFNCPHCGHPAPLSIDTPDAIVCPACHRRASLPASIRDVLRRAASALASVDARLRQIEKSDQMAFGHARGLLVMCIVLGVIPWGGVELLAAAVAIDRVGTGRGTVVEAVGPLFGFLAVLSTFLVALTVLRRFRTRLETNFAAAASVVPGGAPCCRVCGADLPAPTLASGAVSRCQFCRSDSIVAPAVVKRIAQQRAMIVDGQATAVAQYGRARSNVSGAVALILLLLVPFVGIGAHLGWNRHLGPAIETQLMQEAPPLPHRYVLVASGSDACVRRIDEQGRLLDRASGAWSLARPELARMSFAAASVVARSLFDHCGTGAYGAPVRVYSTKGSDENHVVLKDLQGDVRRVPLECVCGYFPGLEIAR